VRAALDLVRRDFRPAGPNQMRTADLGLSLEGKL
jgi:hypothetical protein